VEVSGRIVSASDEMSAHVVVEVRDNGLGVPLAQRERLFERFFRAGVESVSGVEGTGLGLSIVRETVEALGGHAWADFPDGTSVFAFSLPVRRSSDPTPVETADAVSAESPATS
jgi:signal transduction histidine kinase